MKSQWSANPKCDDRYLSSVFYSRSARRIPGRVLAQNTGCVKHSTSGSDVIDNPLVFARQRGNRLERFQPGISSRGGFSPGIRYVWVLKDPLSPYWHSSRNFENSGFYDRWPSRVALSGLADAIAARIEPGTVNPVPPARHGRAGLCKRLGRFPTKPPLNFHHACRTRLWKPPLAIRCLGFNTRPVAGHTGLAHPFQTKLDSDRPTRSDRRNRSESRSTPRSLTRSRFHVSAFARSA